MYNSRLLLLHSVAKCQKWPLARHFFFLKNHNDKYLLFRPYSILRLQNKHKNVFFFSIFPTHHSLFTVYWKYKPVFLLSKHQNMIGYMYHSVKILSTHAHTYHPLNKVKFKFKYKQPSISFIYIPMNNACSHVLSSLYIWYVFMTHF